MADFEFIEHTADTGITARGADLSEAFATAAYAMFTLIADLESVSEDFWLDVEVEADDEESLLVTWLNELLYLADVNSAIFKRFDISSTGECMLRATACGERYDVDRHQLLGQVKAATYHQVGVKHKDGEVEATVILDV